MDKNFLELTPEERALNNLKGKAVEQFAKEYFENDGWTVVYMKVKSKGTYYKVLKNIEINKKIKNSAVILNALDEIHSEVNKISLPDFICEKEDEIIFVEVKSADVKINQVKQKLTLEALAYKGFKVIIFKLPITREQLITKEFLGKEVQPSIIKYTPDMTQKCL